MKRRPLIDRTLEKVKFSDGCWLWLGALAAGYGRISSGGKAGSPGNRVLQAHRVVYEYAVEPIPAGLVLDHLCRNRACVNPDHLEVVTHSVNLKRGDTGSLRQAGVTHCPNGHAYDAENTYVPPSRPARVCRRCHRERHTYASRDKKKLWAVHEVRKALRRGDLTRPAECSQCESEAFVYAHHEDYDKPLDVVWLCAFCHRARHRELDAALDRRRDLRAAA